ncbi:MAG: aspartate kinase [Phycisphaeraceae bacterium]
MASRVCKFGGTSLADAKQIAKVRTIVADEPGRRYVVPSAPGKRHRDDQKITDLLYLCHEHARQGVPFNEVFALIAERFRTIAAELKVNVDLDAELQTIQQTLATRARDGIGPDYAASRGEYLNGLIIARLLDWPFVDPTELIFFDRRGRLDESRTYATIARRLGELEHAVVPGFYGLGHDGEVKTFSRGGSDVTGAILARGVNASLYENWTDVAGLLMADPRVVDNPRTIDVITYRELRELAYMGATVLHDEAIFPVRDAGIPVNIRNTNHPAAAGTMIVSEAQPVAHTRTITGIAGRRDFTVIALEKALMNAELGFGRRVLSVLERFDVNFEHLPSGIDTMSLVISDSELDGKLDDVIEAIKRECEPDAVDVYPEMALVATVGRGMAHTPGMAAKLFTALAEANVNVRMIDQGSSELNIIVGVAVEAFEPAMRAIYEAFVESPKPVARS